ncbi:hypothetical protein IFM89_017426 [Coptis chinensis]|uniref:ALOG domain-containing protein n=1 Tax=Coptis chinensis TaxID=261450 RepID=A0A835LHM3_9MAGN|nr:hypothetical protein IFM89_017426 [Coptis chinensis]
MDSTLEPSPTLCIESTQGSLLVPLNRYEAQKKRDWNTFLKFLKNHQPPLVLERCSDGQVIQFLKNLNQFGNTRVHLLDFHFYGNPNPPGPCHCPFQQAWGSVDSMIGRLRAAYEENGGIPETNLFASRSVSMYLRKVKDGQAKARGDEHKKRKRPTTTTNSTSTSPVGISQVVHGSGNGGGGRRGGSHDIGGVVTFDDFSEGQEVEVTSEDEGFKDSWSSTLRLRSLTKESNKKHPEDAQRDVLYQKEMLARGGSSSNNFGNQNKQEHPMVIAPSSASPSPQVTLPLLAPLQQPQSEAEKKNNNNNGGNLEEHKTSKKRFLEGGASSAASKRAIPGYNNPYIC